MVAKRSSIDGSPHSSHGSDSSRSSPGIPALDLTYRSSSMEKGSPPPKSSISFSADVSLSPESIKFRNTSPTSFHSPQGASSPKPIQPYFFKRDSCVTTGYSFQPEKRSLQETNNHSYTVAALAESDNPAKRPRYSTYYDPPTLIPDLRTTTANIHRPAAQSQPQSHLSAYPFYPIPVVPGSVPLQVPIARTLPPIVPTAIPAPPAASLPVLSSKSSSSSSECSEPRRTTRPFKAYTSNPRSRANYDVMSEDDVRRAYEHFRRQRLGDDTAYLRTRRNSRSPHNLDRQELSNLSDQYIPADQLSKQSLSPNSSKSGDEKDAQYWERRKRNNEAAKRSRDARKAKEDEIALKAAFLEQEYVRLRYENEQLKNENNRFKDLLWRRQQDCIAA